MIFCKVPALNGMRMWLQVKKGTYDLDANLALLRHYNFAPDKANIQAIATMLIMAQMRLPSHDFANMLLLISERLQVLQKFL